MCGGTRCRCDYGHDWHGLSPRVRGNPDRGIGQQQQRRSIPACAGEPAAELESMIKAKVYPRVCGGTSPAVIESATPRGLSPRVRGNPVRRRTSSACLGSIPACAGEPHQLVDKHTALTVYPRVCGGTQWSWARIASSNGLSPRVRGNHGLSLNAGTGLRSIPACAGEPGSTSSGYRRVAVYPRVCGGTNDTRQNVSAAGGLSPRVRGNHHYTFPTNHHCGSIPACAGEPRTGYTIQPHLWVYPRVCGGTGARRMPSGGASGLSPRVRGTP